MAKAKGTEATGVAEADAAKDPAAATTGAAETPAPETAQPDGFANDIPLSARLPQRLVLTVNRYQAQIVKAVKRGRPPCSRSANSSCSCYLLSR